MKIMTIILLSFGALLVALWLFYVAKMFLAAYFSFRHIPKKSRWQSFLFGLRELPTCLLFSAFQVINILVFSVVCCWYGVRGKPMPPPPQFGQKP